MNIGHLVEVHGYLAVFILVGAESPHLSGMIGLIIGGVAIFGITIVLLAVGRHMNRLGAAAEAAYPGPLQ